MGTDARFACPVCSEPYEAPPEDCFRCETPLRPWWRFEEAVAQSAPREARSPRLVPIAVAALLAPLVGAVALRIMTGTAHAPVATTPSASVTTATPASAAAAPPSTPSISRDATGVAPAVISYRVQPGDSLWRIAAALTGDGRNWRTLWPALDPEHPLAVGTVLEAPIR